MTGCFRDKKNIVQFVFCSEKNWPHISHTLPPGSVVFSLLKVQVILVDSFYKEVHRASVKQQTAMQRLKFLCQICLRVFLATDHSYLSFSYASDNVSHWLGKTHILGLKHKSKEIKFKCNLVQLLPQCSSCTDRFGRFFFSFILSFFP